MKFTWDENKNRINIKKHGISFTKAAYVFRDPNYIEDYDEEHSSDEGRYRVIGKVDQILCVIVTYHENNMVRIISARQANKKKGVCIMAMVVKTMEEIIEEMTPERMALEAKWLKNHVDEYDPDILNDNLSRLDSGGM